ncbi:MAG: VOC family protein [Pseudomonadota bacterium]
MSDGVAIKLTHGFAFDHLVWGCADLAAGVASLAAKLGVRAETNMDPDEDYPTISAGIGLGGGAFLEVIAPNPRFTGPSTGLHALLTSLETPRFLTWFARVTSLATAASALDAAGETLRPMMDQWERTGLPAFRNGFIESEQFNLSVPYLIEWRDPATGGDHDRPRLEVAGFRVRSADVERTQALHTLLGLEVEIEGASRNSLCLDLRTAEGVVSLHGPEL